jgi:hypothetical protein
MRALRSSSRAAVLGVQMLLRERFGVDEHSVATANRRCARAQHPPPASGTWAGHEWFSGGALVTAASVSAKALRASPSLGWVWWVTGHSADSRLPQSRRADHGLDEPTQDNQQQPPAS